MAGGEQAFLPVCKRWLQELRKQGATGRQQLIRTYLSSLQDSGGAVSSPSSFSVCCLLLSTPLFPLQD